MAQMNAFVEVYQLDEWYEIINAGALLSQHSDLSGCLFGVDNTAGFRPLFANRGMPDDLSVNLAERFGSIQEHTFGASWVTAEELTAIQWDEPAERRDERVHELRVSSMGEQLVTKWLNKPGHEDIRAALEFVEEVRREDRVFRRPIIRRRDALDGTEFTTVLKLMSVLTDRYGVGASRLVVYFD